MSDCLLEWMSFRGEGRIDTLPQEYLPGPPRRVLGNLSALGHVELVSRDAWRIAPPVLAFLPQQQDREPVAILCGARTPGVLRHLENACVATGARIASSQAGNWPSVIHVTAQSNAVLATAATQAQIFTQYDAGYTLLACVPTVHEWPRRPCQMVAGKVETVRRFSGSKTKWVPSSLSEAETARRGFFRIKRDWDWVSIFKSAQRECSYIDDRAGRMLAAAKQRHGSWNPTSQLFSLPAHLYPPALIARALVLCTGALPVFDGASGRIAFGGVNPAMLRLVLAITGLRLA